jgi:4-hydroxybenzoate polyprenyltransferase
MPQPDDLVSEPPLCVDLDGTLLQNDHLYEALLLLVKCSPLSVLMLPFWLLQGRASFKKQVSRRVASDVSQFPYRAELLAFLREEQRRGRRVVLVTAADVSIAEGVQRHLSLFCETIGSDGSVNLKGPAKAKVLTEKFGQGHFDYAGDSEADLAVWRAARRAVVVSDSKRFIAKVNSMAPVETSFPKNPGKVAALLKACRIHQWAKNILVFVPVLTSHRVTDTQVLIPGAFAFVSFSLLASSVYLLNDLLDLESDRAHPIKRRRALASGQTSIPLVVVSCLILLLAGIGVGLFCGKMFLVFAGIYIVGNLAYSAWFKRVVMLDVVVLACFYTLRLLAGGAATAIGVSDWLLAFSVFFFFGLAMVKRYSELRELAVPPDGSAVGRGYFRSDLEPIGTFGVASGMISVLVLVLYVMSPEVRLLYRHPAILLLLCPLFLYWITRLWFKANRGEVPQDPVVFALTDRTSYIAGILAAAVLYAATI